MKKRENKNSKMPGISITYYIITALYMSIGFLLLFLNKIFAEYDFFKNSSQVNVVTMALTLISIALAMFGLGYSFYTNNKSDKEDEYNTTSLHDDNKSNISVKTAVITVCLIVFLSLMLIFTGFWFYHNRLINGTQLGYAGAIIGGGITLLGVYITIVYTENSRKEDQQRHDQERREDLAIQYKPICTIEIINFEPNKKVHINSWGFLEIPIVRISNKGRGEIYIDDIIIERKYAQDEFKKINFNTMDIGCLSSSDYFDFSVSFLPNIDEINFIGNRYANNLDKFYFTLRFTVIGRNLFGDKIDPITINKKYFLENDDLIAHFDHGAKEYRNLKR